MIAASSEVFGADRTSLLKDYGSGASEVVYAVTPPTLLAIKDGRDLCVQTSSVLYCYRFSNVAVIFDAGVATDAPRLISTVQKEVSLLVFKNRKEYENLVPAIIRAGIKVLKSLRDWK